PPTVVGGALAAERTETGVTPAAAELPAPDVQRGGYVRHPLEVFLLVGRDLALALVATVGLAERVDEAALRLRHAVDHVAGLGGPLHGRDVDLVRQVRK